MSEKCSPAVQELIETYGASSMEELYKIMCSDKFQWTDQDISNVYSSIKDNALQEDIVYFCLLTAEPQNINNFVEYAKKSYQFDATDPLTFFDFVIFFNSHWMNKLLEPSHSKLLNDEIRTKIACVNLFKNTCLDILNIAESKKLIEQIDLNYLEDFWVFFVQEVSRVIKVVEFCSCRNPVINPNEVFLDATKDCPLEIFSRYTELQNVSYDEMQSTPEYFCLLDKSQQNIFLYFTILRKVINLINCNFEEDVNALLEDLTNKLLSIENKDTQMDLLENIFACLFLRKEGTFVCKEKETRAVLFLLKSVLVTLGANEVKIKSSYADRKRLYDLQKLVTDAQWRLELVSKLGDKEKYHNCFLKYMLAPPESLIYLCLKNDDFNGACQVIKIFDLHDSRIGQELNSILKFQDLRMNIHKILKLKTIQRTLPNSQKLDVSEKIDNELEDFFDGNSTNEHDLEVVSSPHHDEKERFKIMFDLLFTNLNWEDSFDLLHVILKYKYAAEEENTYDHFVTNIVELYTAIGADVKMSLPEVLLDPNIPLHLKTYRKKELYYKNIEELYDEFINNLQISENGVLDNNHPSHKTLLKLNKICNEFSEGSSDDSHENTNYLQRLFNYLKAFSKVLYLEEDHSDIVSQGKHTSYFDLLNINRADLVGELLFEKHLNPSEFEKYFVKLKLDFLYHVTGNCFPTINLHSQEDVEQDELYPENKVRIPNSEIIEYIQKRNWFLAFLLKEMYSVTDAAMEVNEARIQTFSNYLKLPRIQNLKVAFENNAVLTAVQNNSFNFDKEVEYIKSKICNFDIISSGNSSPSLDNSNSIEFAKELLEEDFSVLDTYSLCNIFDTALESQLKNVIALREKVVLKTIQEHGFEEKDFHLIKYINNPTKRVDLILDNIGKWPLDVSLRCMKIELSRIHGICDEERQNKMKKWLNRIYHYKKIMPVLEHQSWLETCNSAANNPERVFEKLLCSRELHHLIEFIDSHTLDEKILQTVTKDDIQNFFHVKSEYDQINKLLTLLPKHHADEICLELIKVSQNINELEFLVEYLKQSIEDQRLEDVEISLRILKLIPPDEFNKQLFPLLWDPVSIIEVLIMNTKLEMTKAILEKINTHFSEDKRNVFVEKVDEVVRSYAGKSLNFRIVTQPALKKLSTSHCSLMQSMDSLIEEAANKNFTMPESIPTKEEWVPDNEVTECMCCSNVTFSMFNRRHHCRRCGRVVCYSCARRRMLVPTYGDVQVKVCSNCYDQTYACVDRDESLSTKSEDDMWMLTNGQEHNRIVREEFFYEHTPSVYLCLSIMKLHSVSEEYSRFLLKCAETMLELLNLREDATLQEVDYLLVVKMLRLLAVAIKMSAQECSLSYETSLANKIIAQADLIGLLANRGCLPLLPVSKDSPYIDGVALRKLRDRLLEREQWNLALEVSTKAGLDTTGVFVAWGKSCLKAGSLQLAREKFGKCLDKSREHRESVSDLDCSTDSTRKRNISFSENARASKNPPLLSDIVDILETKTEFIDKQLLESLGTERKASVFSQPDPPLCILTKLKNLQNIANGKYHIEKPQKRSETTNKAYLDDTIYNECIYYLSKYGTALSTVEFHVKHGYFDKALDYIIQENLGPEIFTEIYMRCLKDGVVEILHGRMSHMDSTLRLWKDYLTHLCSHLEKQKMLNCLYQLQLFMGDYMRAAVSCIRFYEEGSICFSDFHKKAQFLKNAEQHLQQVLEQEQWVDVTTESGGRLEEKSIVNPDLVMKIAIKDVYKHLKTIKIQSGLVNFLAGCEAVEEIKSPMDILGEMLYPDVSARPKRIKVPTLFGSSTERRYLAVLCIVSGKSLKNGFDIALRIAENFKLKPMTIYNESGKLLAQTERYMDIAELVTCIKRSDKNSHLVVDMCDEMLTLAVATLNKSSVSGTDIDNLIKLIDDKASKISAYIEAKQLKTAYFLAVKYKRTSDIRRILREAEITNQPNIKTLCLKVLQNS